MSADSSPSSENLALLASRFGLPGLGNNPSSSLLGTTPGSFANPPEVGGARTFSSPDTPGMPKPSDKTAWDFMPPDWTAESSKTERGFFWGILTTLAPEYVEELIKDCRR